MDRARMRTIRTASRLINLFTSITRENCFVRMWKSSTAVAHKSCESLARSLDNLDSQLLSFSYRSIMSATRLSTCLSTTITAIFASDIFLFLTERINPSMTQPTAIFHQSDTTIFVADRFERSTDESTRGAYRRARSFYADIRGVVWKPLCTLATDCYMRRREGDTSIFFPQE